MSVQSVNSRMMGWGYQHSAIMGGDNAMVVFVSPSLGPEIRAANQPCNQRIKVSPVVVIVSQSDVIGAKS